MPNYNTCLTWYHDIRNFRIYFSAAVGSRARPPLRCVLLTSGPLLCTHRWAARVYSAHSPRMRHTQAARWIQQATLQLLARCSHWAKARLELAPARSSTSCMTRVSTAITIRAPWNITRSSEELFFVQHHAFININLTFIAFSIYTRIYCISHSSLLSLYHFVIILINTIFDWTWALVENVINNYCISRYICH